MQSWFERRREAPRLWNPPLPPHLDGHTTSRHYPVGRTSTILHRLSSLTMSGLLAVIAFSCTVQMITRFSLSGKQQIYQRTLMVGAIPTAQWRTVGGCNRGCDLPRRRTRSEVLIRILQFGQHTHKDSQVSKLWNVAWTTMGSKELGVIPQVVRNQGSAIPKLMAFATWLVLGRLNAYLHIVVGRQTFRGRIAATPDCTHRS